MLVYLILAGICSSPNHLGRRGAKRNIPPTLHPASKQLPKFDIYYIATVDSEEPLDGIGSLLDLPVSAAKKKSYGGPPHPRFVSHCSRFGERIGRLRDLRVIRLRFTSPSPAPRQNPRGPVEISLYPTPPAQPALDRTRNMYPPTRDYLSVAIKYVCVGRA